ncbi:MAG: heavy metal sensor histidine kinase [Burkholderiaceae bacterium]|nr:heavy metal sensor histidine kinase [Burkholderiaceae bacterium]
MLPRLSLTHRLTLFFTLVASSVVLGLGGLFMAAADQHFVDLDRGALQDKQDLIGEIIESSRSSKDLDRRLDESLNHHHGLFVRVSSGDGRILFQTEGYPAADRLQLPPDVNPLMALMWWRRGQQEFRHQQFQAEAQYAPGIQLTVSLAMDTAHHQHFLNELLNALGLYALAAIVVSGLLGWAAVYYGLAPLRAIKAHAAAVTAQRLQPCMPVQSVPIEMADLAKTLNQMLERLQDDFQRLSEFSSDLAHELRTPISNLLTQTQVTLTSKRENEVYKDVLASNAEELQRLARMVSDMLLLAKTERRVDLPHKEDFMAADEVQALIDFYEAVADDKSIALTLEGNGPVQGDRLMFRRALSNLMSNALRYAPSGSCVKITVASRTNCTDISVENSGEDIDPLLMPRLFDRFYRVDQARSHLGSDGVGLGLAITKAIVEAHGGSVYASSARGITRFTLTFPH